MGRIAIIGSGRWARVIAQTLCALPGVDHQILMFSRSQVAGLSDWIKSQGLTERISAEPGWPDFGRRFGFRGGNRREPRKRPRRRCFRCRSARDCRRLSRSRWRAARARSSDLAELATRNATMLAASHVLLFARYVDAFASLVGSSGKIKSIEVAWSDPAREIRYGELKSYDPSLPIIDDILPHVVPLVLRLGVESLTPAAVGVSRGGAQVDMDLTADRSTLQDSARAQCRGQAAQHPCRNRGRRARAGLRAGARRHQDAGRRSSTAIPTGREGCGPWLPCWTPSCAPRRAIRPIRGFRRLMP